MNAPAKVEKPMELFRSQLEQRLATFADALPPHISVERFKSVVAWAVMADPALLGADRVSLFEACLAAANDGLLPDKREGALVIYNTKVKEGSKEFWIQKVQWLPMVRGVITKVYNTGKVKSVSMDLVYGGDAWRYWKDDQGEHYQHEPAEDRDKSIIRRVYAAVVMKDSEGGGVFAEPMDMEEIEKVRKASKTPDRGPWKDWWEEMAKKTPMRRLAKRLPIAREIGQVLERDNFLYDVEPGAATSRRLPPRPPNVQLGAPVDTIRHEKPNSETTEPESPDSDGGDAPPNESVASQPPSPEPPTGGDGGTDPEAEARRLGAEARAAGAPRKVPKEYQKDELRAAAWTDGYDTSEAEDRQPGSDG